MRTLSVELSPSAKDLRIGIRRIAAGRPGLFSPRGLPVRFARRPARAAGYDVTPARGGLDVVYGRITDAFRALGRILAAEDSELASGFAEAPLFDTLGVMIDVSRNAVLLPETLKTLLPALALMGLNMCMLYAEDTYQVPGEPFFGYLRGAYSQAEMRSFDRCAASLGIEMLPCIQALAHLEQVLQWPAYKEYRDTSAVLLADDDKTYCLVEKMIRTACAPFRSKRIHLGMDEAMGIGLGRHREIHGDANAFDILNRHLARVTRICRRLDLKPMIWSDMYFRIGSRDHEYYDTAAVIPAEVARRIPRDVQLVYWDYYHEDAAFYADFIDRHRALAGDPVMAGGVWTWNHFWTDLRFSFKVTGACMTACKSKGLREAFVTLWGDDGNECDIFSALPGIQFFAEHGYAEKVDPELLPARLRATSGCDFDPMVRASDVDNLPWRKGGLSANPAKWLLWQDPLLAFLDPLVDRLPLKEHYAKIASDLDAAARKPGNARLRFPAQLARVVSLKVDLRRRLARAQAKRDTKAMRSLVAGDLARLTREVRKLWCLHRAMWLSQYKPFGWEVIEHRYGGLVARLESAAERLLAWASGKGPALPELSVKFRKVLERKPGLPSLGHARAKTPSCIK